MHDIDRALFEAEAENEEFGEAESHELSQEVALATELLEVSGEAELDRFLGKLLSTAVSAAKGFAKSDAGRAVGGVLKSAAKQALPHLGGAVGGLISPSGGALGQKAGQWLSGKFELGLETEGLSAEDREYEAARAFVRFANETAQRAAKAGPSVPPAAAAQRAAVTAAQRHLPGLLRPPTGQQRAEGRWVRRGNRIVILDA
jgi:hypothetical protein